LLTSTIHPLVVSADVSVTGAYNTSIVASSSRMFSHRRHHDASLGAKSRSLSSVQSWQSAPALCYDPSPPVNVRSPPRRQVRSVRQTPSPLPPAEPDPGDSGSLLEPSPPSDQLAAPLLSRHLGSRSTSYDALAVSARPSLVAEFSLDRRSL